MHFKKALENRIDGQDFETSLMMKTVSTYCLFIYSRPAKIVWHTGKKNIDYIYYSWISFFLKHKRQKRSCIPRVSTLLIKILMIENKIIQVLAGCHLIFIMLWHRSYYYTRFTDEKTEAWGWETICLRSYGQWGIGRGISLEGLSSKSYLNP